MRRAPTVVVAPSISGTALFNELDAGPIMDDSAGVPKNTTLSDIYVPILRKYEASLLRYGPEHLDIVTAWKGISVKQGHELVFWRSAFEEALKDQLRYCRRQGENLFTLETPHRRSEVL